jgi:hypothetical protein
MSDKLSRIMAKPKITPAQGLLIALIVLGLLTRLLGIGWGLPYFYHVDEKGFGKFTIHYFTGDLNPHFFQVPSCYTYMTAAVWGGYYLGGKVTGRFTSRADLIKAYNQDPTVFFLLGRLLTVILAVGTIILVFMIGRRMYGTRAGALAALLLIFSLEHVKMSHYFIPDVTMVFFLMVSFLFIWSIYTTGKASSYILAGLFAGLAYATKYGGHFLALPLLLAHFFRAAEKKEPLFRSLFSPKLAGALLSFIGGFLAGCPYSVLDSHKFLKDFRWQTKHLFTEGHFGSSTAEPSWLFYLKYGFRDNVGRVAQFLVPAGVIYGLVKHRKKDILLLSLPVILFLVTGTMKSYATRYLLPITAFFILIAALFLDELLTWIGTGLRRIKRPALPSWAVATVLVVAALVFIAPSVLQVARYDDSITRTDTRTVAKNWVEANIPKGSRIALEMYGPPLDPKDYRFFYRHTLGQVDLDWLAQRRVEYVIISDIMYLRFTQYPLEFPKEAAFYRSLDEKAYLLKTFTPRWDEDLTDLHNPTIKLYWLSRAPNYSFPGGFREYAETVRISAAADGRWAVRALIEGRGPTPSDEKLGRPYIRFTTVQGRETWKAPLGAEPLPAGQDFRLTAEAVGPPAAEPFRIMIGYESTLTPELRSDRPSISLNKEALLAGPVEPAIIKSRGFEGRYFYSQFPGKRGDLYFQSATLTRQGESWSLAGTAFGGKIRWGLCNVLNPFVKITDKAGKEVSRLTLFQGKVGGLEAGKRAPASARVSGITLPENFRLFFGYESFYDQSLPKEAGGPEEVEIRSILQDR